MEINIDPINEQKPTPPKPVKTTSKGSKGGRGLLIGIIVVLMALLVGTGVWFTAQLNESKKAIEQERIAREEAELDRDQSLMTRDFDDLNRQFEALEGQTFVISNDSLRRDINEKYKAAKERMAKLQKEVDQLRNDKARNAAEISKLKGEIETLRQLLRNYVEQIAQLNEENKALRNENAVIKEENSRLTTRVQEASRQNERLTERVTLAEKLNVTGVNLTALNKKGKNEKKVEKANQLVVTFTIPQNNSTPVGEKTIYLRLISPSGQLLGSGGSFSFEGSRVQCSAKRTIEYAGEEVPNINIYWDVNTALTPGDYTVELFADNYRLVRRTFTLK